MTTLFIGIGSSGLRVLEEAQQYNYEITGKNRPNNAYYLYLETNLSNKPRKTPLGKNHIKGVYLSLKEMAFHINQFRNNKKIDSSWIPDTTNAISEEGVGGKSAYGRLALWTNFDAVKSKIESLNRDAGGFKSVFIVGTLTGGTGSGILIDLAYLVRHLVTNAKLQSILMIPKETDLQDKTSNYFTNSYYAIKALEYFSTQGTKFKITWPDGRPLPDSISPKAPFDMNIIVSPDYFHQSSIDNTFMCDYEDLSPLFKTIGLYISLLSKGDSSSLEDLQSSRWIDGASSNGHITQFITIGLSLIQYPKALLEEFVALDYSKNIIQDWISDRKYSDKEVDIKKAAIRDTEGAINYVLANELNDIKHEGASSINDYLKYVSGLLVKKRFEPFGSFEVYVNQIFTSDSDSNIFKQIKNKLFIARDSFIKQISEKFNEIIQETPNLSIAKFYINSIHDHLDDMLLFWQNEYKIDDNQSNWNRLLEERVNLINKKKGNYEIIGLKKEYVNEQLINIASFLKLHLLVNEVRILKEHLIDPTNLLETQDNSYTLPSISLIKGYIKNLSNIIDNGSSEIAYDKRIKAIKSMRDTYGMNFNLYPQGSFESETASLKSTTDLAKVISSDKVLESSNLWEFIQKSKNLYFDILTPIVEEVRKVNQNANISLDNLISSSKYRFLSNIIGSNKGDIQFAPPALVKLDQSIGSRSVFSDSGYLKTIFMHKDVASMNIIRNSIRNTMNEASDNLDKETFIGFSLMQNSIAIVKSYGYFGGNQDQDIFEKSLIPSRDLTSLKNTREQFISKNIHEDENYIVARIPYFDANLVKKIILKND